MKDKLFLFGNYEGFRERLSATQICLVPGRQPWQGARQGYLPNASGTPTPVNGLNSAMLPYMNFWPVSQSQEANGSYATSAGTAKYISNPLQSVNEDFGTARLDYLLGHRDTLSGAYTNDTGTSLLPQPDPFFASALAVSSQVFSLQETHMFRRR